MDCSKESPAASGMTALMAAQVALASRLRKEDGLCGAV